MKRVIVELKVPAGFTMQTVMAMDMAALPGFQIDSSYDPVPVSPSGEVAATLGVHEEVVLVRGEIEEGREAELRAQPNVVNVWTDARIEPFGCGCSEKSATGLEEMGKEQRSGELPPFALGTSSPCPPTDCEPTEAKGTIEDVARYLRCDRLWAKGVRGSGIVIGICDTGVDKSKIPAVIGGWSPNFLFPPGTDAQGHGSMTATDALGMCPDAKIYDIGILKTMFGGVPALLSNAIKAYQWALDQHKTDKTPQILSNSWGIFQKSWAPDYAEDPNHPFTRKVVEVIESGILVTFAAGNCGSQCPSDRCGSDSGPGRSIWGANGHPRVITVGAANILEQWIGYSSQGPAALDPHKPDFCAPSHFKGYTKSDNGTSAANPVCAGVVGLLRSYDPNLTQDKTKEALQKTAKNLCAADWDPHSGYGMIQAEAAFNYLFGSDQGTAPLHHGMWIHGVSIHEEDPGQLVSAGRKGAYAAFDGKPGTSSWFHFSVPTPVIVGGKRLKLDSIALVFLTDPDVWVTNVHIYDGNIKIGAHDGLSLTGERLFERFDVQNPPVRYGIGISIGVKFGVEDGRHSIAFVSGGADFIV